MTLEAEDAKLVEAAKQDPQAFVALYQKYVDDLYSFIFYRCGQHSETAEDLTADVFTKAFAQLQNYSERGFSYRALLYAIARNTLIDYYRISDKQPLELDPDSVQLRSSVEGDVDIKLMWEEIRKFGPDVTELFELRYLQGLSYDDIAEVVGKKSGAIRTKMSRTLDALQAKLASTNSL